MVEHTRVHERLQDRVFSGETRVLDGVLERPVEIYVPEGLGGAFDLLIHFHGVPYVAKYAVESVDAALALAVVNMGTGSAVYETPFAQMGGWERFSRSLRDQLGVWNRLWLSGFSAGYGALGAVLASGADGPDGVLVLDGLHTGYAPPHRPLAVGGVLKEGEMAPFVDFACKAVAGERAMLITHSEVFPGTFASTTETADALVGKLDLERKAVLDWGPLGMQQLSQVRQGRLALMGYAGNSSPDHMDHLYALYYFLDRLLKL
jgi:hypothetical protein